MKDDREAVHSYGSMSADAGDIEMALVDAEQRKEARCGGAGGDGGAWVQCVECWMHSHGCFGRVGWWWVSDCSGRSRCPVGTWVSINTAAVSEWCVLMGCWVCLRVCGHAAPSFVGAFRWFLRCELVGLRGHCGDIFRADYLVGESTS